IVVANRLLVPSRNLRSFRLVFTVDYRETEQRYNVRRDPLEDRLLVRARLVDQELADPDLAVAAHDVLERVHALPRVGQALLAHVARPAVEGAPDLAGVAPDRRAALVED